MDFFVEGVKANVCVPLKQSPLMLKLPLMLEAPQARAQCGQGPVGGEQDRDPGRGHGASRSA